MGRPNARMFAAGFDVDAVLGDGRFDHAVPFFEEVRLEILPLRMKYGWSFSSIHLM